MSSIRAGARTRILYFAAVLLAASSLFATSVLHMDLKELCQRADRIYRGTVLDISSGSVALGGGTLPTVTYRIKVSRDFVGNIPSVKEERVVELRMLGTLKAAEPTTGPTRRLAALPDLPQLRVGQEYLLLTTAPSSVGLQATVGLGQGCFSIFSQDKQEMAQNELKNLGLFDGPVSYTELATQIQALVGQ